MRCGTVDVRKSVPGPMVDIVSMALRSCKRPGRRRSQLSSASPGSVRKHAPLVNCPSLALCASSSPRRTPESSELPSVAANSAPGFRCASSLACPRDQSECVSRGEQHTCLPAFGEVTSPSRWSRFQSGCRLQHAANPSASTSSTSAIIRASGGSCIVRLRTSRSRATSWSRVRIREGCYVGVEPRELDQIAPRSSRVMEVLEFVPLGQVDPIYLDTS